MEKFQTVPHPSNPMNIRCIGRNDVVHVKRGRITGIRVSNSSVGKRFTMAKLATDH